MRLPKREKPQVKRQDIQPVPEVHRQKEPDPPVPGLQENGNYRYYSTQRPVDLGSFPKPLDNPVVEIHNYDADSRVPVENGMIQAWGYVDNGMIRLLRNATNNLNQIAKKANSGDGIYGADITNMQAKQDEIWEAAKEILARLATIQ